MKHATGRFRAASKAKPLRSRSETSHPRFHRPLRDSNETRPSSRHRQLSPLDQPLHRSLAHRKSLRHLTEREKKIRSSWASAPRANVQAIRHSCDGDSTFSHKVEWTVAGALLGVFPESVRCQSLGSVCESLTRRRKPGWKPRLAKWVHRVNPFSDRRSGSRRPRRPESEECLDRRSGSSSPRASSRPLPLRGTRC